MVKNRRQELLEEVIRVWKPICFEHIYLQEKMWFPSKFVRNSVQCVITVL